MQKIFNLVMLRFLDLSIAIFLIITLFPISIIIIILIRIESPGSPFHTSKRVGLHKRIFLMYKFRSMRLDTPNVATHLLINSDKYITKIGKILRKSSLDEIPQLINVLKGQMSFVGPRPALFNQNDLVALRDEANIFSIKPGITGLAQINGRDDLSISEKVKYDKKYLSEISIVNYFKILFLTFIYIFKTNTVKH